MILPVRHVSEVVLSFFAERFNFADRIYLALQKVPLYLLLITSLLSGGCADRGTFRSDPQVSINLNDILPEGWVAIDDLRPVNLDGDAEDEFLLLYSYDNGLDAGPVGATIYDFQRDAAFVTGEAPSNLIPIPNQPTGFYVPYRILPNYWEMAVGISDYTSADVYAPVGQFIAPPGTTSDNIVIRAISWSGGDTAETEVNTADELLVYGGSTHLTIVWWKNTFDGYGVVQLHAPFGFEEFFWGEGGLEDQSPLMSVVGRFLLNDRSRLCRKIRYRRASDPQNGAPSETGILYSVTPLGIRFCQSIPRHPFYPEGVVLAYLLDPVGHAHLVQSTAGNDADTALLRQEMMDLFAPFQLDSEVAQIVDLQTRASVPYPPRQPGGNQFLLMTNVCVEIESLNQKDVPMRQFVFSLRHRPPNLQDRITDRWLIDSLPQVMGSNELDCYRFIQMRPPDL